MDSLSKPTKEVLTIQEIRHKFFGKQNNVHTDNILLTQVSDDLTPSAKYVVREARKQLGQQNAFGDGQTPDEDDLYSLVKLVESSEGEELSERERTSVVAALSASLDHYDILTPLIEKADVNDIIVNSYNDISIQTRRTNFQTDLRFADHDSYVSFVENLLKRVGKSCTVATPVIDTTIDPHIRACVTHQSFSPKGLGPTLTLRISRHQNISIDGLVQNELAPRIILEYLSSIARSGRCTILVSGEVGTGKTTLIKALTSCVDPDQAILIIEDTHELLLERNFVRTLLTREANTEGSGRINPALAIRTGMRMAMNRLILGEMRDAEAAEAFIDVCSSGHGGMSTIHARSARDAVSRLELFLARAQGNIGIETIRRQIANAVGVVVYLGLDSISKKRRIMEIVEIGTYADEVVQFSPIISFTSVNGFPEWKRDAGISVFDEMLKMDGIFLPSNNQHIVLDPEHVYKNYSGQVCMEGT